MVWVISIKETCKAFVKNGMQSADFIKLENAIVNVLNLIDRRKSGYHKHQSAAIYYSVLKLSMVNKKHLSSHI